MKAGLKSLLVWNAAVVAAFLFMPRFTLCIPATSDWDYFLLRVQYRPWEVLVEAAALAMLTVDIALLARGLYRRLFKANTV